MSEQLLKNRVGQTIGRISTSSSGIQTLKSASNRTLGTYDPKTNTTKDSVGLTVGSGNLLSRLL